ncbi:hypothetical protein CSA37_12685 [Candidatus Fermentibacteria bacterium]|nr:MAG: hypothetical protein CSA37_12685 [Candidatus Fermentibacteria bacterium]
MKTSRILFITILFFLLSCARVVAPTGGPEDTDGPEITGVTPSYGQCDVIPNEITFSFSEKISQDEGAVQIYPCPGEIVTGSDYIRVYPDSSATVVVVTVSGDLRDRRGNPAGYSSTFVWNTSGMENFGTLNAQVTRSGGGEVTETSRCDLFLLPDTASRLTTVFPDSTDTILAEWLTPGEYLVHCYEDNDRSLSWDMEREPGVLERFILEASDTASITLNLSITDSIGPSISAVTVIDGWHLNISWNEQISDNGWETGSVLIAGPDGSPLEVLGFESYAGRSSTGRTTVYTRQMSDTLYTVAVEGIQDLSGNPSLPDTLEIWGVDSLPVNIMSIKSAYPEDGAVEVPPSGPFTILFSDWVYLEDLEPLYSVTQVSDSTPVAGTLSRIAPGAFSFVPERELLGGVQYRIDVDSGLVSLQGDTLSGRSWTFIPAWSERPGSISGYISGTGAATVVIVVSPAGSDGETVTELFTPGEYTVTDLPGGRYTAACFVDWNGDKIWNPGEPYGAWPGVVEVLPGIDTGNVNIQVVP